MGSPRPSRQLQPHRLPCLTKYARQPRRRRRRLAQIPQLMTLSGSNGRNPIGTSWPEHVQPIQQISNSNSGSRMRLSMHNITLVSLDVLEAYIQNAGLTGCEEQRDRLKREKDMHRALRALVNAQMQGQAVQK